MITKEELSLQLAIRDKTIIDDQINNIVTALQTRWNGKDLLSIDTGFKSLAKHVVKAVSQECNYAGWSVGYFEGGSDQRDGDWNAFWEVG